ncbi:MAG: hypothetical protein AAF456_00990 [Planctomycetota bacterium]
MSRLASIGACAGAVAISSQTVFGTPPISNAGSGSLSTASLEAQTGSAFLVSGPEFGGDGITIRVQMTLTNVTEVAWVRKYTAPPVVQRRECPVSLIFYSRVEVQDATYRVGSGSTPETRMFLHRIGGSGSDQPFTYEAILT